MSVEENRNCNCNDNMANNNSYMNNSMNTTISNVINNEYMNDNNGNDNDMMCDCNMRERLLHQIMAYDFGINELALYLDTHNDDEKALCLHNRYCKEAKDLKDKYQKVYGPLTIEYPCNKWRWIEEPWPSFDLG